MPEIPYFTVQRLGGKHGASPEYMFRRIRRLAPEGSTITTEGNLYPTLIVELPKGLDPRDMETVVRKVRRLAKGYHLHALLPFARGGRPLKVLDDSNRALLDADLRTLGLTKRTFGVLAMNLHARSRDWVSAYAFRGKAYWPIYIGQLVRLRRDTVEGFRELGPMGLTELEKVLEARHLGLGMDVQGWEKPVPPEPEELPEPSTELLDTPVSQIDFGWRVNRVLGQRASLLLGELVQIRTHDLPETFRGCGPVCLRELEAKLTEMQLRLGMRLDWTHPRFRKAA